MVRPNTLTSHFQVTPNNLQLPSGLTRNFFQEHFKEHSRQSAVAGAVIELGCDQCSRKFRYRKALDHHMKKAHSGQKKQEQPPTKEQKSKEQVSTRIKCDLCQKRVDSEWHLAPSRHNCPGITAQVKNHYHLFFWKILTNAIFRKV